MVGTTPEERRKYARLSVRVTVRYSVIRKDSSGLVLESASSDPSFRGIRVHSAEELAPGTVLSLELHFPGHRKSFGVSGVVRWSVGAKGGGGYWCGVQFLAENTLLNQALLRHVSGETEEA